MTTRPAPALPPRARRFASDCGRRAKVTLVGPLLERAPACLRDAVLFVDGGSRWRDSLPAEFGGPVLSVGDGDSCADTGSDRPRALDRPQALDRPRALDRPQALDVLLPPAKDYSDLGFALEVLRLVDVARLDLLGFLGGRRDHEWVNFGELARFAAHRAELRIDVFDGAEPRAPAVTVLGPGAHSLKHAGTFTLAHFVDAATTLRGAIDYPLGAGTELPAHSSLGLSNRAHGRFQLQSDQVSLLFWVNDDATRVDA